MPPEGHGPAWLLSSKIQRRKKGMCFRSVPNPSWACGPSAFSGCCWTWLPIPCLSKHLPDAAARLKGKKNWFQFPTWECPHPFDLDQGYFPFLPILGLFALHTVLVHFPGISFSLFLLGSLSSRLALCPDPFRTQQGLLANQDNDGHQDRDVTLALGRLADTRKAWEQGGTWGCLAHLSRPKNWSDPC